MELQKGRPENTDNRLDKEIRVYDFLDKLVLYPVSNNTLQY